MDSPGRVAPHEEDFTLAPGAPPWLGVMDRMQEAAGRHAARLGVGLPQLAARGITWVLVRNHVRFARPPRLDEPLHLATWPTGRRGLLAVRDFRLCDGSGEEVLRATSAWLLMRLDTRRPVRLDPHLPDYLDLPGPALADDFEPLPEAGGDTAPAVVVQPADIDVNDHVNNIVYLEWALRAAPSFTTGRCPGELEVAFLGEARLGDEVRCRTRSEEGAGGALLLQSLENGAGRELTRLRSFWPARGKIV